MSIIYLTIRYQANTPKPFSHLGITCFKQGQTFWGERGMFELGEESLAQAEAERTKVRGMSYTIVAKAY